MECNTIYLDTDPDCKIGCAACCREVHDCYRPLLRLTVHLIDEDTTGQDRIGHCVVWSSTALSSPRLLYIIKIVVFVIFNQGHQYWCTVQWNVLLPIRENSVTLQRHSCLSPLLQSWSPCHNFSFFTFPRLTSFIWPSLILPQLISRCLTILHISSSQFTLPSRLPHLIVLGLQRARTFFSDIVHPQRDMSNLSDSRPLSDFTPSLDVTCMSRTLSLSPLTHFIFMHTLYLCSHTPYLHLIHLPSINIRIQKDVRRDAAHAVAKTLVSINPHSLTEHLRLGAMLPLIALCRYHLIILDSIWLHRRLSNATALHSVMQFCIEWCSGASSLADVFLW